MSVCGANPPLPYEAGRFAGVFAFSVLTHIHPTQHHAWYTELHRILRPRGIAYLTTQGTTVLSDQTLRFPEKVRTGFLENGSSWLEQEGHCKDAAFVDETFTRRALEGLFEIVEFHSPGYHNMDAFLVRRM